MLELRTIPEDLMMELEDSIRKCQVMDEENEENLETCLRVFGKVKDLNKRNQDEEYREWKQDYEESVRCCTLWRNLRDEN